MRLQAMWTDGQTDGQTDRQGDSYIPPPNYVCGGYKKSGGVIDVLCS